MKVDWRKPGKEGYGIKLLGDAAYIVLSIYFRNECWGYYVFGKHPNALGEMDERGSADSLEDAMGKASAAAEIMSHRQMKTIQGMLHKIEEALEMPSPNPPRPS